jgi:hypothetical protein
VINIDIQDSVPPLVAVPAAGGARGCPNVVYIVLDDTRFSAMEPRGGLIDTAVLVSGILLRYSAVTSASAWTPGSPWSFLALLTDPWVP